MPIVLEGSVNDTTHTVYEAGAKEVGIVHIKVDGDTGTVEVRVTSTGELPSGG
jgi:hypothetical protein